jgi:hypothetical protein
MNNPLVDVVVGAYGKPYQTTVSILSLLKHSGQHIGKVWLREEFSHPFDDNIDKIFKWLPMDRIIHHKPLYEMKADAHDYNRLSEDDYRRSIWGQLAWECTDKDYIFFMHDDVLFTEDCIGDLLENIGDAAGIGHVGCCHNCPASKPFADLCSPEKWESFKPTYEEVMSLIEKYPNTRTTCWADQIEKETPMPMPECALVENSALINVSRVRHLVSPIGNIHPYGFSHMDGGKDWFRGIVLSGERIRHYEPKRIHGWATYPNWCAGYPQYTNEKKYRETEAVAKRYLEEEFGIVE